MAEIIDMEKRETADVAASADSFCFSEQAKPYTFRKLNSTDLFLMIKLINKVGIDKVSDIFEDEKIKNIASQLTAKKKDGKEAKKSKDETEDITVKVGIQVAIKLVNQLLQVLPSCETDIYSLLANTSNLSVDEVKALDIDLFMQMIFDFVTKPEFGSFFKGALRLIK